MSGGRRERLARDTARKLSPQPCTMAEDYDIDMAEILTDAFRTTDPSPRAGEAGKSVLESEGREVDRAGSESSRATGKFYPYFASRSSGGRSGKWGAVPAEDDASSASGLVDPVQDAANMGGRSKDAGRPDVVHTCCRHCPGCRHSEYRSKSKTYRGPGPVIRAIQSLFGDSDQLDEDIVVARAEKDAEELKRSNAGLRIKLAEAVNQIDEINKKFATNLERNSQQWEDFHSAEIARLHDNYTNETERQRAHYSNEIAKLSADVTQWRSVADEFDKQLAAVEQFNSRSCYWTGSYKDSAAIPGNLEKTLSILKDAALNFTSTFVTQRIKDWTFLEEHAGLETMPSLILDSQFESRRYRKCAVQAFICRRLFAGFENDCYFSEDNSRPQAHQADEENDFFLTHQDSVERQEEYLRQYNRLLQLMPVQNVITSLMLKTFPFPCFERFCLRKLADIADSKVIQEFFQIDNLPKGPPNLCQLATHPEHGEFCKSFLNLALYAWLLHRLAFSFKPPARILRYARGVPFDQSYMELAFPIDEEDLDTQELTIEFMVVPGFEVNNTIVKATVHIPGSVTTDSPSTAQQSLISIVPEASVI